MSHVHEALRRASQTYPPQPLPYEEPDSLDLRRIVSILQKRKRLFLGSFFVVFAILGGLILLRPDRYEAEMKLLVNNGRQDLVISPDKTSSVNSADVNETVINSEIELLRSDDVLRNVVLKSGLNHTQAGSVEAAGQTSPITLDRALSGLRNDLKITPVKKSDIIDIIYPSKDPRLASEVLNNLAKNYLEAHLRSHGTPGSYAFFEQQANNYRDDLKKSEDELKVFQQKDNALVQPDQNRALTQHSMESQASLEEVNAQIADYEHRISQNQTLLKSLDARVTTRIRTVPQGQLIGNLNQTLIELRNKRTDLATKFRSDDRMVVEVDKQIADTSAALQDALSRISTENETDTNPVQQAAETELVKSRVALSGLLARRESLSAVVGDYKKQMMGVAGASIEHEQLVRKVKENEDNYLLYRKKSEEARIAESLDQERITNVAIIQAPVTPVRPSNRTTLYTLIAAIFAFLLAGAFAVNQERRANKQQMEQQSPAFVAAAP